MSISDTPGRGKKLCPKCQKYIGARSTKCENCGAEFSIQKNSKVDLDSKAKIGEDGSTSMSRMFIQGYRKVAYPGVSQFAPYNKQPPRLKGVSREDVLAWIPKVMEWGHEQQVELLPSALRYIVRGVYEYGSVEYQEVCNRLNDSHGEDIDDDFVEPVKPVVNYANPACEDHGVYTDNHRCMNCGKICEPF